VGNYTITAKATNSNSGTTTSAARTVKVEGTTVSGNVYYIHTDHLDTPREITNEQNQTVWKNPPLTEPFGSTPVDDDPDGDGQVFTFNLRFPGQYYDQETGTHYNYYRDNYLPDFGRYGQSDPIGLAGGINTYAYVNNNPLIFVDPLGLITQSGDNDDDKLPKGGFYCSLVQCACGASGGGSEYAVPDNPFKFPFKSCCQGHDQCYGDCKGPTREECDDEFYFCMRDICDHVPPPTDKICRAMALIYYFGVSGKSAGEAFDDARNREECKGCKK
jgi:RHS repeat-associated protein